jgi:hypothetical protein
LSDDAEGCETEKRNATRATAPEPNERRTAPRVTIPEPELTEDKKFKCPIDQTVYDNRKDYDKHCKIEHDVL